MATQSSLLENRTIRVFISSTFQDMQDELMKKTFTMLLLMAAERDVTGGPHSMNPFNCFRKEL